ncbi:MAG: glycosyltransferase, partial [Nitrospirales bacterium]|nr:glycosyltransferase [Nitrospirales bacterium]
MMPKVTVIIPVFNGQRYIREALNSVFTQTYRNYEIVIVDDGSKDGSLVILDGFGDRIQLIQQANHGQAEARNAGIKRATGKYVAFLDQDDVWYPSKLERQVALLEADSEAVMVHCDMDSIDENGNVIQQSVTSSTRMSPQKGLTMTRLFGWDPCIYPSTMLIRRTAIDRIGGFDPEIPWYGEDIDLMLRLREIGHFLFLEEAGTQYRKHSNNFSGCGTDAMFNCAEKFFRKLKTRYGQDRMKDALLERFLAQI